MSRVILSCSFLRYFVDAAQEAMGTAHEVIEVDRALHAEPSDMRERIADIERALPPEVDTLLVAMGFCGGAWDSVTFGRRVVIPRVDDCVSMLLQCGDAYAPNLKEPGHMYMASPDKDDFIFEVKGDMPEYKGFSEERLFDMFFSGYHHLDVVDTGLTDCYSEEYATAAQANADRINADLGYVEGSNRMLEKLVSGRWDEQFLVAEPGQTIRHRDFFE